MFSLLKRFASPVAAIALFAAVPRALHADSVTYNTVATFTNGGTAASFTSSQLTTSGGGTFSLSGETKTVDFLPIPSTSATFANFTSSGTLGSFTGARIQIDVFETATNPGGPLGTPPQGTFVGTAFGALSFNAADDTVHLQFDAPYSFLLPSNATSFPPGVVFSINPTQDLQVGLGSTNNEVRGNVAAVPLPSTAWMGLGLLGCVGSAGAFKSVRRRRDVLSA